MIFTDGEKVLGTISVMPVLGEGEYEAIIQKVEFLKDCKTDWGFRDFLEVTYSIAVGVTEQLKKEKIMVSQAENSKCYMFLLDLYKGDIPKEINVEEWVERRGIITIKHNVSDTGKVYANIVERKFI